MQLIIAFAVLGLLVVAGGWLLRPTPPARLRGERSGDASVLRPPPWRNVILATMAVGPTVLVVVVAAAASRRESIPGPGLALVGLVVVLGLATTAYFVAAELRLRVHVDASAVERFDPGRSRRIAWGEVRSIAYNGVNRWFVVTSTAGTRVWIPESMSGIGDFADAVLARVRPEVLAAEPVTLEALRQIAEEARREDAARG